MAYKQVRLGDYFRFEKGLGYKGEFLVDDSDVALIGMDSHLDGGGYKENSEKPYSGRMMVRVAPELHAKASIAAQSAGTSLNQWVSQALERAVAA